MVIVVADAAGSVRHDDDEDEVEVEVDPAVTRHSSLVTVSRSCTGWRRPGLLKRQLHGRFCGQLPGHP